MLTHSSNINVYVNQLRKLFIEALIVTEAIYDLRESDNFPRTFATQFIITKFHVI